MTELSNYKSVYTAAFILENLALIKSVEALDDYTARTAPVKDLRKSFIAERTDVTDYWKQFIGYCNTAYANDVVNRDAMLGEAGQTYYNKVSNGSWKEVEGLLSALVPFVQNHKDELMQKGYMPASFVTRLEEKQTSFYTAYQTWKSEDKATSPATEAKIIACNDLKDKAAQALSDAQKALIKDKATAQKFVWATILDQVRGEKPTGLGGKVTLQDAKKGNGVATVSISSLGLTVQCDNFVCTSI